MLGIRLMIGFAAVLLLFAAGYLAVDLRNSSEPGSLLTVTDVGGFNDLGADAQTKELLTHFTAKSTEYRDNAQQIKTLWLWLNFAVTALTAACTMLSGLKASDSMAAITKRFALLIAGITFVSSLASWGDSRLSEAREEKMNSLQAVKDLKSDFFITYGKETADDKKAQLIQVYDAKLADL